MFSAWVHDREGRHPRAVYEQVIHERMKQYGDLKQAVAGILYMRNKLEAEIRERRRELARTQDHIRRAVQRGDDEVALALIGQRDALQHDLERNQRELEDVSREAEAAKGNLVKFRHEIRALEREKVRMLATFANAQARKRIQEAFEGLSLESDVRALENVRSQIAQLTMESRLDRELMADGELETRIRSIHEEARMEAARRELAELKRRLHGDVLPASVVEPLVQAS
jgi:phage shock protein A